MNFNLVDSQIDERDHIYSNMCGTSKDELPSKFINKVNFIKDQRSSMKCGGFATSYYMEIKEQMRKNTSEIEELSPQFIYYNAKTIDGNNYTGTTPIALAKAVHKYGVCMESLCKFVEKGDLLVQMSKPSNEAYIDAEKRKTDGYAKLFDNNDIKKAIYNEGGALIMIKYFANMLHPIEGFIPEPTINAKEIGNHFVCLIGWDDTYEKVINGTRYKGFYILVNSYGDKEGIFGIEYLPYEFLKWRGGRYKYDIDKVFREGWTFYDNTNVSNNKFHIQHQPEDVIAKAKPVNIKMNMNSNIIVVDGKSITMDTKPTIRNNTTFVPIRFVAENMNCNVTFDTTEYAKYVLIRDKSIGQRVDFGIGHQIGYVDGKEYKMQRPAFIENGRTMIPIRAVSEMLGCTISFDNSTKNIIITR